LRWRRSVARRSLLCGRAWRLQSRLLSALRRSSNFCTSLQLGALFAWKPQMILYRLHAIDFPNNVFCRLARRLVLYLPREGHDAVVCPNSDGLPVQCLRICNLRLDLNLDLIIGPRSLCWKACSAQRERRRGERNPVPLPHRFSL
jgi:hypothetical protein